MSQVFNNLLLNARQAMPGGGEIQINVTNSHCVSFDIPGMKRCNCLAVSIKDEGYGIPEGDLKKIFDPYYSTKEAGHGLGLTSVFSIVQKHGGHIDVQSEAGKGACFTVFLPAIQGGAAVQSSEDKAIFKGRGRILIMDDDSQVREVTGEMLKFLGYETAFAREGEEAARLFKEAIESGSGFDVVFLDLTIPGGLGGREAVQMLLDIDSRTKVIASSGYSSDPIMSTFREYGFSGAIVKPYGIEELSEVINKVRKN